MKVKKHQKRTCGNFGSSFRCFGACRRHRLDSILDMSISGACRRHRLDSIFDIVSTEPENAQRDGDAPMQSIIALVDAPEALKYRGWWHMKMMRLKLDSAR